jgi:spore coat protein U-like protein
MSTRQTLLLGCLYILAAAPDARAALVFNCTVSTTGISFGTYNPLSTVGSVSTGAWAVTCTATGSGSGTVSGTLSLSTGASDSYATRYMRAGANKLAYNVYLDPGHSVILGNGSGGSYAPSESGTVTAGQLYQVNGTLYGFLPALQNVAPGSYADTLVVTITY